MALTMKSILDAEKKAKAENLPPPYVRRVTRADMKALCREAMRSGEGVQVTGTADALTPPVSLPLDFGERIVSRVGDTFLVARA